MSKFTDEQAEAAAKAIDPDAFRMGVAAWQEDAKIRARAALTAEAERIEQEV